MPDARGDVAGPGTLNLDSIESPFGHLALSGDKPWDWNLRAFYRLLRRVRAWNLTPALPPDLNLVRIKHRRGG